MIPINLTGKVALVTGVGDNLSFAWYISKTLQAAGAKVVLACHPRVVGIVEGLLRSTQTDDVEARKMPDGSDFQPAKIYPCDASYDTMDDVPSDVKGDRRYAKFPSTRSRERSMPSRRTSAGSTSLSTRSRSAARSRSR